MLKWTVSKRVEPIVQFTAVLERPSQRVVSRQSLINEIREHRRKSEFTKRYRNRNKENAIVASPHPITISRSTNSHTLFTNQLSALRDVANKTPKRNSLPASHNSTPLRKRNLPPSPAQHRRSTPAFSLETVQPKTSPPASQCGSAIAMRGITVPDTYFGSARYIQGHSPHQPSPAKRSRIEMTPLSRRLGQLRFSKVSIQRHAMFNSHVLDDEDDLIDMSSKALDNSDLNKMIDEILLSTRKCKPIPSPRLCVVPPAPQVSPSSTILTASSADRFSTGLTNMTNAADLTEVAAERTIILQEPLVEEREVRTPPKMFVDKAVQSDECLLRRQGGVRRKNLRSNRMHQAETEASRQTRQIDRMMQEHPYLRKSIELLACLDTPKQYRWL